MILLFLAMTGFLGGEMWKDNIYTVKWHEKDGTIRTFSSRDLLKKIGNINEKLDPRKSGINTITFNFTVDNFQDEFSKFLYLKLGTKGKMFFREIVEIYKQDIIIYKGFVRSVKPINSYEVGYEIELENVIGKLKTSIWDREFSEYSNETIENINATRLATGFVMEERIVDDTQPIEKQEKYKVIVYVGHIMDCLKGVMQTALSKAEIKVNTLFLDNKYESFLNLVNFEEIKAEFNSNIYNVYFEFLEPIENIFSFFQEQIFQAMGVVPVIDGLGRLKLMVHQQPTIEQGIKTFGKSNVISFSKKGIDESQVVNFLKLNYVLLDDEYKKSIVKINNASFEFFGNELIPEKPQEISIDSINKLSRADQVTFCSNIADRLFSRYSREINTLDIKVPIQEGFNVQLGSFVKIDSEILIDWTTGERGFKEGIQDQVSSIATFDDDVWGGFIDGNTLGIGADGTSVVTTTIPEISLDVFRDLTNSNIKSFIENHNVVKAWVEEQIK